MYDFAAEPGNNELTVSEGEIITITNPVRKLMKLTSVHLPELLLPTYGRKMVLVTSESPWLPFPEELAKKKIQRISNYLVETNTMFWRMGPSQTVPTHLRMCSALFCSKHS